MSNQTAVAVSMPWQLFSTTDMKKNMQKTGTACPLWVELGFFEIRSSWFELSVRPDRPYLFSACHNAWQVIDSYVLIKIFNDFYSTKYLLNPPILWPPTKVLVNKPTHLKIWLQLSVRAHCRYLCSTCLAVAHGDYVFSFLNYTQVEVEVEVELCLITLKLSNLFLVELVHCSNIL